MSDSVIRLYGFSVKTERRLTSASAGSTKVFQRFRGRAVSQHIEAFANNVSPSCFLERTCGCDDALLTFAEGQLAGSGYTLLQGVPVGEANIRRIRLDGFLAFV